MIVPGLTLILNLLQVSWSVSWIFFKRKATHVAQNIVGYDESKPLVMLKNSFIYLVTGNIL